MGALFKRKDQRGRTWVARWREPDGTLRHRNVGGSKDAGRKLLAMVESDIARGEYRGADAYRGQQVVAIDAEVSISAMVPDLLNEIERLEAALARVGKRPLAGLAPRPRMKWGTSPCGARVIVKWGERLYPIEPCTEHCNYGHHWPASSWRVLNEISFVATPTTTEDKT